MSLAAIQAAHESEINNLGLELEKERDKLANIQLKLQDTEQWEVQKCCTSNSCEQQSHMDFYCHGKWTIAQHHLKANDNGEGSRAREKQRKQMTLPFRALSWDSEVHPALFVHRVEGLPMGLYFLLRNEDHFHDLKRATRSEFKWEKPEGCPDDLPLYELARGSHRQLAKKLSCHQVVLLFYLHVIYVVATLTSH
ncbi:hypothetical protein ACSBR1_019838 [Camellia fascicularis]